MADARAVKVTRLPDESTPGFMLRTYPAISVACFAPVNAALRDSLIHGFRFARIKSGLILLPLTRLCVFRAEFSGPSAPFARRQFFGASGILADQGISPFRGYTSYTSIR